MAELTPAQQEALARARQRLAEKKAPQQPYSGSILPFSRNEQGKVSFDSDAGLLGALKRAALLPRDVAAGDVDPMSEEGIARAFELGSMVTPISPANRGALGSAGFTKPTKRLSKAEKMVLDALRRDGLDPASVRNTLGPEGRLLDLGDNLAGQAEALATKPGQAQASIRDMLAKRMAGAGQRISHLADDTVARTTGAFDETQAIQQARIRDVSPLYEAAKRFDDPLDVSRALNMIDARMTTAVGKGRAALNTVRGMLTSKNGRLKAGAGNLHEVRSEIGRIMRNEGRDVSGYLKPIQKEIDRALDQVPGYAQARAGWAESYAIEEALESGQKIFRRSTRPDELAASLQAMGAPQKAAFKKGARDAIFEIMGTARNDAGAAIRELSEKGWNREKIALIIGQEDAQRLFSGLNAEKTFANTANRVTQNSRTAARQEAIKHFGATSADEATKQFSEQGGFLGAVQRAGYKAANRVASGFNAGRQAKVANEVAGILTAKVDDPLVKALMERGVNVQNMTQLPESGLVRAMLAGSTPKPAPPDIETQRRQALERAAQRLGRKRVY